jgi:hypothetical protein
MSVPRDNLPPHYHALRAVWTALQVVLLLVVLGLLAQAIPPGDLIGGAGDWARDLL